MSIDDFHEILKKRGDKLAITEGLQGETMYYYNGYHVATLWMGKDATGAKIGIKFEWQPDVEKYLDLE